MGFEFHAMTPLLLEDLERFSLAHGKFRYCSCMRWRMSSAEWSRSTKEERVAALEDLVRSGTPVGVLVYLDGEVVGWCSIAPRETYRAIERSRTIHRVEGENVWSVVCFFLDRRVRHRGLTVELLRAAVELARTEGAAAVEGYPSTPGSGLYRYMGSIEAFRAVGFEDVTPEGSSRTVVRRWVSTDSPTGDEGADL